MNSIFELEPFTCRISWEIIMKEVNVLPNQILNKNIKIYFKKELAYK